MKNSNNNKNNLSMNNINDNISLYYKYLNYDKNTNIRKSLDKNNSAPNIYLYNSNNSSNVNRKKFISNYLKKINNGQNASSINLLSKNNDINFATNDNNTFLNANNTKNNNNNNNNNYNNNYSSKNNLKKLPFNNTNNTFNMNKNITNINLTTSILGGDNLNLEKYKVQQKLSEYRKLIDKKIDDLMKDKKTKINKNNNVSCDIENRRIYSPKAKLYKKISKITSSSEFGRNKKKKIIGKFSNTNFKNISNENIRDKITIIPKRIQEYEQKIYYNPIINKDNINNNILKKVIKNGNVKGKIYLDSYNEMMINKKNIY